MAQAGEATPHPEFPSTGLRQRGPRGAPVPTFSTTLTIQPELQLIRAPWKARAVSDSVGSGWGPRSRMSHRFSGDAAAPNTRAD